MRPCSRHDGSRAPERHGRPGRQVGIGGGGSTGRAVGGGGGAPGKSSGGGDGALAAGVADLALARPSAAGRGRAARRRGRAGRAPAGAPPRRGGLRQLPACRHGPSARHRGLHRLRRAALARPPRSGGGLALRNALAVAHLRGRGVRAVAGGGAEGEVPGLGCPSRHYRRPGPRLPDKPRPPLLLGGLPACRPFHGRAVVRAPGAGRVHAPVVAGHGV
mmetsp:Transcript_174933/g.560958  ORF Transcript_174933/g.560958 Transcript_174933/m.560958 type:complete len:218 (+) Transcript_174933:802-1455(+)